MKLPPSPCSCAEAGTARTSSKAETATMKRARTNAFVPCVTRPPESFGRRNGIVAIASPKDKAET
jgi:hypothetical protein